MKMTVSSKQKLNFWKRQKCGISLAFVWPWKIFSKCFSDKRWIFVLFFFKNAHYIHHHSGPDLDIVDVILMPTLLLMGPQSQSLSKSRHIYRRLRVIVLCSCARPTFFLMKCFWFDMCMKSFFFKDKSSNISLIKRSVGWERRNAKTGDNVNPKDFPM